MHAHDVLRDSPATPLRESPATPLRESPATPPTVTALGHAGLRIDAPGVRLLADPWMTGGAFLGSWFPFPDNAHMHRPDVLDVDVVTVSHEHLDHLDLDLIAGLPAHVPIVVPRYPSPILERRLRAAGRDRVVALDAWERYPLGNGGDDWLTVIPEQCPMRHDAGVLIHVGGHSVMHTNDARISLAQVRRAMSEVGGPIDTMFVQMSGASWHPVCYEYDDADRARLNAMKRVGKFKAVTRLVRSAAPRMVLPYAGPPCFLGDDLFEHNSRLDREGIFPDQAESLAWLEQYLPRQRSAYLLPGDRLALPDLSVTRDAHWEGFDLDAPVERRRRYLEEYAARRRPQLDAIIASHPEPAADSGLAELFKQHFESLGSLSAYFLARIGLTLRFEVSGPAGGCWDVVVGPDQITVNLDGGDGHADYRLRIDSRWVEGLVSGRTRWEELMLSLRFSARREPDHYNDYLMGFLKHADLAALRAVEEFEAARDPYETFELQLGERRARVSRYCPHSGEDLSETAVVSGGVLRCLGHNFEFDLTTGECVNARCDPLVVEPVDVAVAATAGAAR
ncbi:MAG TPA: MBL fold metallo-hydrolase [Nocardioidaceae bacterium]|nr:MBL fold metallo-hydrolase [Nocardioidaceae bacterium]